MTRIFGASTFSMALIASTALARVAHRQCHPLENIPGDAGWRKAMVAVYVRRTLRAALDGSGPVHHL